MRGEDIGRTPAAGLPDAALWQLSRNTDASADDAERILDLAGFADGCLDPDDRERVAERLAEDPLAAGDVAAARVLGPRAESLEAAPEPVIARACALVSRAENSGEKARGTVISFPLGHRGRPRLHRMAGWGSLVAAMAVASWLGFTLGMDASRSFGQFGQAGQAGQAAEDGFLGELLDPSNGFMRDLTEGAQT
jgi:anti-sigma factor RsiW